MALIALAHHAQHVVHHVTTFFEWAFGLMARRLHSDPPNREQVEERARYEVIDAVNKNEADSKEVLRLRNDGHTWVEIWRMIQTTKR